MCKLSKHTTKCIHTQIDYKIIIIFIIIMGTFVALLLLHRLFL